MINIIACIDLNGGLGYKDGLLYHISDDLKRFKQLTKNKTVVMGRKTFESIIEMNGKPLSNRHNVVLTRDKNYQAIHGETVCYSIVECTELLQHEKELWICGGANIYEQFLNLADNIYLTVVHESHKLSDAFYPRLKQDSLRFTLDSHESHHSDKYNAIYSFKKYSRKK